MATSLKALKECLPVPYLVDWLISQPDRVDKLYTLHSREVEGRCLECHDKFPCKFNLWAVEAQEYLRHRAWRTDKTVKRLK